MSQRCGERKNTSCFGNTEKETVNSRWGAFEVEGLLIRLLVHVKNFKTASKGPEWIWAERWEHCTWNILSHCNLILKCLDISLNTARCDNMSGRTVGYWKELRNTWIRKLCTVVNRDQNQRLFLKVVFARSETYMTIAETTYFTIAYIKPSFLVIYWIFCSIVCIFGSVPFFFCWPRPSNII